jgi:hypothetical protein
MFNLYYMGSPQQAANATFTSKNAAPQIADFIDVPLFLLDVFYYLQYWQIAPTSQLDANSLREPGKLFPGLDPAAAGRAQADHRRDSAHQDRRHAGRLPPARVDAPGD